MLRLQSAWLGELLFRSCSDFLTDTSWALFFFIT